jgi:hypothetical protein
MTIIKNLIGPGACDAAIMRSIPHKYGAHTSGAR